MRKRELRPHAISGAVGAGLAVGFDEVLKAKHPGQRLTLYAALLVGAAAVYPLARRRGRTSGHGLLELAGLGAYGSVGVLAARRKAPSAGSLIATGWASHAIFDLLHHSSSEDSMIPDWYPAFCAGYDLTLAALLRGSISTEPSRP